jgi:hypothetical protein
MSVIRVSKDKNNPYLIMNKACLDDISLSWKAKGILTYLLSLPDDWKVYIEELSKHTKDGIKSTNTGIKELITAGYIERKILREEITNRFAGYEYIVSETPKAENGKAENRKGHTTKYLPKLNNNEHNNNYNDNGTIFDKKGTSCIEPLKFRFKINETRKYFAECYFEKYNKKYHRHIAEQNKEIDNTLNDIFIEYSLGFENMQDIIDKYFSSVNCDHNLMHFISDGIIKNRIYEIS